VLTITRRAAFASGAFQGGGRMQSDVVDPLSHSNPGEHRVRHIALDLTVDFERKALRGSATLTFDSPAAADGGRLVLDTRELQIEAVEAAGPDGGFKSAPFQLGAPVQYLGQALTVTLPPAADRVRVRYASSPRAAGLQWLDPAQTADGSLPFVYTQAEPTYARSYLSCQDTPSVRVTYEAALRVPAAVTAVMAAENKSEASEPGVFRFAMPQPVPSYLIALAAGALAFESTGTRAGDWAEPSVVAKAAWEFVDAERMVETAESLFGPYRWGRWDLLVLPPSFPYGGMENPTCAFLTPTIIAGDRSLVDVITHELAHSWFGNLVTNATWSDFWLNEGFTVYAERRITEVLYGREVVEMERQLGRQDLQGDLDDNASKPGVTQLKMDLTGLDPEDGQTTIPYEMGALFLLLLEQSYGRERFDPFLRGWFDGNAFTSRTTEQFLAYLRANLLPAEPAAADHIGVREWLYPLACRRTRRRCARRRSRAWTPSRRTGSPAACQPPTCPSPPGLPLRPCTSCAGCRTTSPRRGWPTSTPPSTSPRAATPRSSSSGC
jgi:aminopeptidase N